MRTGAGGRVANFFAWQMLGQRSACRLLLLDGVLDCRRDNRRGRDQPLGLVDLQTLDCQLELIDLARQLL